jgi:F1F0 ATPase subunit 2
MNDPLHMVLAFPAGMLLGSIFFGGLWLTVRKMISTKQPALLIAGSLLLRMGTTLLGFYYIGVGNWHRLLICLLGFLIARWIIMQLTRPNKKEPLILKKEAIHEA